jgi:hypothetical protein
MGVLTLAKGCPVRPRGCRYAVGVYRVILPNINPPLRVSLFNKTFDVPACPPSEGGALSAGRTAPGEYANSVVGE